MDIVKPTRIYGKIDERKIGVLKEGYTVYESGELLYVLEVRVTNNNLLPSNKVFKKDKISDAFLGVATLAEMEGDISTQDFYLSDFVVLKNKSLLEINKTWEDINININNLANEAKIRYETFSEVSTAEYPVKVIDTGVEAIYKDYLIVKEEWERLKAEREIKQREYNEIVSLLSTWKDGISSIADSVAASVAARTSAFGQFMAEMNTLAMGQSLKTIKNNTEIIKDCINSMITDIGDLEKVIGKVYKLQQIRMSASIINNSNDNTLKIMEEYFVSDGEVVSFKNMEGVVNEISSLYGLMTDINAKVSTIKAMVDGYIDQLTKKRNSLENEINTLSRKIDIARKNKDELTKEILEKEPNFDTSRL